MADAAAVSPSDVTETTARARRRLVVVYNPVKVDDVEPLRRTVAEAAAARGWDEPDWVETTEEDPGEGQAREAVRRGADVVASLGGDGTVRAVASALVGTDVALGLLPGGTGNLLARNLGLPVDSLEKAMTALLDGSDRRIDVGLVTGDDEDDATVFLVMTGLGLDGEVMAETNEKIKAVVGWAAYVLAGAKRLFGRGFPVEVRATGLRDDEGADHGIVGQPGNHVVRHARTVVVGNCGTLQGGIELMPEARIDDGVLDGVVIAPNGAFGWGSVVADIVSRHRVGHQRLDRLRGREVVVTARHPVEAEVDGEAIGPRRRLVARIEPDSLVVRVG